jgi:hypothetical protein
MRVDGNALQWHLWADHWVPAANDERNEERGRKFWHRATVMVQSGRHPHYRVLARGIARYGVPAHSVAALYVAYRMARAINAPAGNPGGSRAVPRRRPPDDQLRAEYRDTLAQFKAMKATSPAEFSRLAARLGHTRPSAAAMKAVGDLHHIGYWTVRNAVYRKGAISDLE